MSNGTETISGKEYLNKIKSDVNQSKVSPEFKKWIIQIYTITDISIILVEQAISCLDSID